MTSGQLCTSGVAIGLNSLGAVLIYQNKPTSYAGLVQPFVISPGGWSTVTTIHIAKIGYGLLDLRILIKACM